MFNELTDNKSFEKLELQMLMSDLETDIAKLKTPEPKLFREGGYGS